MEDLVKCILKKENIEYKRIEKADSGFTNIVYFVDNMVIKIADQEKTKKKLYKEVSIYKNIDIENIPKYIASGEIDNIAYLIISKLNGKGLYSVWHILNNDERRNCVKQIANIIKTFNKHDSSWLSDEYIIKDWEENVISNLKNNMQGLEELGINANRINSFMLTNNLFKENKFGLVYNDAHFDNFIYNDGKIFLIDFDRVIYAPIDYEMMIFKTMCDNPSKFASEADETSIFEEDFDKVYTWMQEYYSELFAIPNVDKRIKVYQFNYLCHQALTMKNREIGNSWAKSLVNDFDV